MGKKTAEPVAAEVAAEPEVKSEPVATGPKRFKVQLSAHTPIEFNGVTIEAVNAAEAKAKFCEMNGIVDSACPWDITEVTE
jgi:hypothetical protein